MPYSYNYGHVTDRYDDVFKSDHGKMIELMHKYHPSEYHTVLRNGYFSGLDSVILYSMVREYRPSSVLEIGAGLTTSVILKALERNGNKATYDIHALAATQPVGPAPLNVTLTEVYGDLLDTFPERGPDPGQLDFVFIDGCHEAYFAVYYFHEILMGLPSGALVHIHDFNHPDVLTEANRRGWAPTGESWPVPTPSGEAFAIYMLLRHNPGEFEILCETSMLLKDHPDRLAFVHTPKGFKFRAAAQSLWMRRR